MVKRRSVSVINSLWLALKEPIFKTITTGIYYLGVVKLLRSVADRFYCDDVLKNPRRPLLRRRQSRSLQILVYHRVNNDHDLFFPATPINVFTEQMKYLADHCCVLSLEDALARTKRNDLPENAIVLTFDDGYRDNYLYAYPVLRELSLPATIFLATDAIGSGRVLWHDKVFSAFRETRMCVLKGIGGSREEYSLSNLSEKLQAQDKIITFLRSLNDNERSFWIERLIEALVSDSRDLDPKLMLTWDDVKIMHQHGMSFGSHTVNHPILSRLTREKARREIYDSKQIIEHKLGSSVTTFAYPGGKKEDFNEETKKIVGEAGYTCGLTAIFGTNTIEQDSFELKRGTPWEEDLPRFATKLHWYKLCH